MYVNGMGFRAIERVMGVNHNTVIRWVRNSAIAKLAVGIALPNAPEVSEIPEITEIDELQMRNALARKHLNSIQVNGRAFVGKKK